MVGTPITINSRGLDAPAKPEGRRRLTRAAGIAIGVVALGAFAGIIVGLYENQSLTSAASHSDLAPLPGDLFAPPPAPKPRVVVRYLAPRSAPSVASAAAPIASATPSAHHRPSPSPSPSGGGDD